MKSATSRSAIRARIAKLAEGQHGVVTRRQLLESGLTPRMIHGRLADARLRAVHRGIYLVGPAAPPPRARDMAAVLACGPGGVLSHRSAAALHGLLSPPDSGDPVDVSITAGQSGAGRAGIRVHRVRSLEPADVTNIDGVPVTNALRTILDLAAVVPGRPDRERHGTGPGAPGRAPHPQPSDESVAGRGDRPSERGLVRGDALPLPRRTPPRGNAHGQRPPRASVASRELEHAVARAERMGLVELPDLEARIAERRRRPGTAVLRRLLERDGSPAMTRSRAEEAFLSLVRGSLLPQPAVNARVGAYEVDFLWREQGLAVEVDGFAFHASRDRFEGDRRRDAELAAGGILVIRVTWRQLTEEPLVVLGALGRALGRAEAGMGRPMAPGLPGNLSATRDAAPRLPERRGLTNDRG